MKRNLTMMFIVLLLCVPQLWSQTERPFEKALKSFKAKHGSDWEVQISEKTGIPSSLQFGKTRPQKGRAEDIAWNFLNDQREIFKMRPSLTDMKVTEVKENKANSKTSKHVRLEQFIDGVRVEGSGFYVHMLDDGSIDLANGDYYPDIKVDTKPKISKEEASKIAQSAINQDGVEVKNTELVIYPKEYGFFDRDMLLWQVDLPVEHGPDWRILLETNGGKILNKTDRRMLLDGYGHAWDPGYQEVVLHNLDGSGGLRGTYAKLTSTPSTCNEPTGLPYSPSLDFRSYREFKETAVNVYYQIDKFRSSYWNSSFNFSGFQQISFFITRAPARSTGYSQSAHDILFADGTDRAIYDQNLDVCRVNDLYTNESDAGRERNAIYHEYTHAIRSSIKPNFNYLSNLQGGAINEGLSDYFAVAFSGTPYVGTCVAQYARDIRSPKCSSYSQYQSASFWTSIGESFQQIHWGGNFFSSILWNIRTAIGSAITDKLVYGAIFNMADNSSFQNFRDAMITESNRLYGGAYNCQIVTAFTNKGIGGPCLTASISGPTNVLQGGVGTWSADVAGGDGGFQYEWLMNNTILGFTSSISTAVNDVFTLRLNVTGGTQKVSSVMQVYPNAGGCPFVFAETENGMLIDNNILHRSEFKANLNTDMLDLYKMNISPIVTDHTYRLQVKELNGDHSYFDEFNLKAVDHSADMQVGVTEDNRIVSYRMDELQAADEIRFDDGETVSDGFERIEGTPDEKMYLRFSQTKIAFIRSLLNKATGQSGARLAILIGFKTVDPSAAPGGGGGKDEVAFLDDESLSLSKSADNRIQIARRELSSTVLVPISSEIALDEITIRWNREYAFGQIGIVPVYEMNQAIRDIPLKSAIHSTQGNVLTKLTQVDNRYAELDTAETIELAFKALDALSNGLTRSFIFETKGHYVLPKENEAGVPKEFDLKQNYPNPFNPSTTISFALTENTPVTLKVYNMLGQEVRTLVDNVESPGIKNVTWDGKDSFGNQVASGVYIYKLKAGKIVASKKMLFVK